MKSIDDLDSISTLQRVDGKLVVTGEKADIDVKRSYPEDQVGFYTRNRDTTIDEIRDSSSQTLGADVVEEDIAPELIEQREGWDIVYAEQKGGTDAGIDLITRNPDGDYVITEVKFTRQDKTPGKSLLDSRRELDDGTEVRQMTDEWIQDSFEKEISEGSFDEYSAVDDAVDLNDYDKEVIVVQDGPADKSIVDSINELQIDDANIVRTRGVTGEGP